MKKTVDRLAQYCYPDSDPEASCIQNRWDFAGSLLSLRLEVETAKCKHEEPLHGPAYGHSIYDITEVHKGRHGNHKDSGCWVEKEREMCIRHCLKLEGRIISRQRWLWVRGFWVAEMPLDFLSASDVSRKWAIRNLDQRPWKGHLCMHNMGYSYVRRSLRTNVEHLNNTIHITAASDCGISK